MATGIGLGTTVTYNSVLVPFVRKVVIKQSKKVLETTNMDITGPGRTYIGGLIERTVDVDAFHDAAVTKVIGQSTSANYTLTINPPGASSIGCDASVTSENVTNPMDGIREHTVSFKVSGAITFS